MFTDYQCGMKGIVHREYDTQGVKSRGFSGWLAHWKITQFDDRPILQFDDRPWDDRWRGPESWGYPLVMGFAMSTIEASARGTPMTLETRKGGFSEKIL